MRKIKKTFQIVCCCVAFSLTSLTAVSQNTNDFKTITVNKQVKEFPEKYSKETPIDVFISMMNIIANGKMSMKREYSSYTIRSAYKQNTLDREVSEDYKNQMLNWKIKEYIVYKDSAAAFICSMNDANDFHLIIYFTKENGEWLNVKEDAGGNLENSHEVALNRLPIMASYIPMIEVLKQTPKDTINFTNYIKTHGKHPKNYVLDKLAKHKLVIYGEMHRRPVSWHLMRQIIADPKFVETTGTVFMEFASFNQKEWEHFYEQEDLDKSILLKIFGSQQINGWVDKGQFDFMIALRELNKKLPAEKKIKVVFADFQVSLESIETKEQFMAELKNAKDRNTQMADIIQQTIESSSDNRNSLFIVGFGHAYKTHIPGMASTVPGQVPALSAGAQLVERFSDEAVFSILPHCATINNNGFVEGKVRNGIFDYAFEVNGNKPVAFDLKDSPFGKEPFDAFLEVKYDSRVGKYSDNYDGYIFFGKLENEMKGELLLELFTDDFVNELKRRATMLGMKQLYNMPIENLNKEDIISSLKKNEVGKLWNFEK